MAQKSRPPQRGERLIPILVPIIVAIIAALGTIVAAVISRPVLLPLLPATQITISSTAQPPTIEDFIQKEIRKLRQGKIVFNPSKEMTVGVEDTIEARISKVITESLVLDLKGTGMPITRTVAVGTFMKVSLYGQDKFEIKPITSESQVVADTGFTQWIWRILPVKSGQHPLFLVATVRIKVGDAPEETKDIPIFEERINVKVNLAYSAQQFAREYWQWILASIILPTVGYFAKRCFDQKGAVADINSKKPASKKKGQRK